MDIGTQALKVVIHVNITLLAGKGQRYAVQYFGQIYFSFSHFLLPLSVHPVKLLIQIFHDMIGTLIFVAIFFVDHRHKSAENDIPVEHVVPVVEGLGSMSAVCHAEQLFQQG